MSAYYNEFDPAAAAWLRELIRRGIIADGEVDERSIVDVRPDELRGFTQCHFFAGIGVWSYALRRSNWPDDMPVWTGSCPCQPFSAAGKGQGFADERHLWPAFFHLIEVCGPERVFGEQVAGKDGLSWLDLVSSDLEAVGYTCGAVPFPAAGIGAPHIRERLYWVADRDDARLEGWQQPGCQRADERAAWQGGLAGGMADAGCVGVRRCGLGQASSQARRVQGEDREREWLWPDAWSGGATTIARPGPTNDFWADADWLGCRDARWRPAEPGTFPLAHGAAARVGRLRGYGNAIVAPQAQAFIEAYIEVRSA